MSDVALIYLVLVGLYLLESAVWIRPGCTAISSFLGRFRNPANQQKFIGNESGQISTVGIAPFDATFIVEPCPVSLSMSGVLGFNAASAIAGDRPVCTELLCHWDDVIKLRRQERELWVADGLLCRLGSSVSAKLLADRLHEIANVPIPQRPAAIKSFVASQFDVEAVRQRIEVWNTATRAVKNWSSILAIWIFVAGLAMYQGWLPMLKGADGVWVFVIGLVVIWWTTNLFIYLAHRRLYPESRGNRWKTVFTSMASPAVSMRATDQLARNLLGLKHPLTVAAVLCRKDEVTELTASVLRDLHYPKLPDTPTGSQQSIEIADHWRQSMIDAVAKFAEGQGISMTTLIADPQRQESDAKSYCPRCLAEFPAVEAFCTPCGNRPTIVWNVSQFRQ